MILSVFLVLMSLSFALAQSSINELMEDEVVGGVGGIVTCIDSDGGAFYGVRGGCADSFGGNMNDGCIVGEPNNGWLREITCEDRGDGSRCQMNDYECPSGCASGTCFDFVDNFHPADTNKDWRIDMDETSAYTAAWKNGLSWQTGPSPPTMSYAMRAVYIWLMTERYSWDDTNFKWIPSPSRGCQDSDGGRIYGVRGYIDGFELDPEIFGESGLEGSDGLMVNSDTTATLKINNWVREVKLGELSRIGVFEIFVSGVTYFDANDLRNNIELQMLRAEDFCDDRGRLMEFYCDAEGEPQDDDYVECEFGCIDGACAGEPQFFPDILIEENIGFFLYTESGKLEEFEGIDMYYASYNDQDYLAYVIEGSYEDIEAFWIEEVLERSGVEGFIATEILGNDVMFSPEEAVIWRNSKTRIVATIESGLDSRLTMAYLDRYPSILQGCDFDVTKDDRINILDMIAIRNNLNKACKSGVMLAPETSSTWWSLIIAIVIVLLIYLLSRGTVKKK